MKTISTEEYIDYKEIVPEVKKPKLENSDSTLEKVRIVL